MYKTKYYWYCRSNYFMNWMGLEMQAPALGICLCLLLLSAFAEDWSLQLKWCSPRNESHSVRMCYLAGLLLTWPRVAVNQRLFCTWSWSSSCWRFNSWGEYLRLKARIFSSGITVAPSQPQFGEYRMWLSVGLLWAWPHCRWSHWGGEP